MKAKVTKSFRGVIDGEIHPREIGAGEVIEGSLAVSAVNSGKAVALSPENKMMDGSRPKKNGPIGGGKQSSSQRPGRHKVENK